MVVYAIDILVKSEELEHHIANLCEAFTALWLYKMKLNLEKCTPFNVFLSEFLGFMVLKRGIEANLENIRAIIPLDILSF